jgi:hypothetical protein
MNRISRYFKDQTPAQPHQPVATRPVKSNRLPRITARGFVAAPLMLAGGQAGPWAFYQQLYSLAYETARRQVRERLIEFLRPSE